ncbi:hypothetical protein M569_04281, partial [Genlisea aurea]
LTMAKLLPLTRVFGEWVESPREVTRTIPTSESIGESGWLIRFFDSAFFCEWIAVSYLYKHEHSGVRDYLCNRMYSLPISGIESYLFQICYMCIHKPCPALDKFVIDICSKSLKIALKVHWFLMAELEDVDDNDGISRIQEKCQIAATLRGEWPPLLKPHAHNPLSLKITSNIGNSSAGGKNQMFNKLLSSKPKFWPLTSSSSNNASPPPISSPSSGNLLMQDDGGKVAESPEDGNKILKRLIPSPKMRDALLFRKTVDKEDENSEKDGGFLNKFLKDSRDEDSKKSAENGKENDLEPEKGEGGFFKRLLRDSRDEDSRKSIEKCKENDDEPEKEDGLFKRSLSTPDEDVKRSPIDVDKEKIDEHVKEGSFFTRWLRDSRDEEGRKSKDKENEDVAERERGFFKRLLRDNRGDDARKPFERNQENSIESEKEGSFFKRFLRDGREDALKSLEKHKEVEQHDKDGGFLKRLLSSGRDEDATPSVTKDDNEFVKDGFFRRFRNSRDDAEEVNSIPDGFFKRLFKDSNTDSDERPSSKATEDDDKEGFFKKFFKDKFEERKDNRTKNDDAERGTKSSEGDDKNVLFREPLKEKNDDKKDSVDLDHQDSNGCLNGDCEEASELSLFRKFFRVHPEDSKNINDNRQQSSNLSESSPGTEKFFRKLFKDRERSVEESELYGSKKTKTVCPGSPKQQNENSTGKPPLPDSATQLRKRIYHDSLDFVLFLCETSYGLVDVFPVEDRKTALHESLIEINTRIDDSQSNGGVCFPMGKGMYRVIHIPEYEAVLLNSREKAPYMICVEVLKSESPSNSKDVPTAQKLSKGGIPLANGDAFLPKPPPWAYPLWSRQDMYNGGYDRMARSTSEAIDQAMAQWDAKMKFVRVNFSVEGEIDHTDHLHSPQHDTDILGQMREDECTCNSARVKVVLSEEPGVTWDDIVEQDDLDLKEHRRVPSTVAMEEVKAAALKGEAPAGLPLKGAGQDSTVALSQVAKGGVSNVSDALAGELWEVKKERIRKSSSYGQLAGWDLRSVIVKSGDDCRQEHVAVQLISHFYDIFQEAGLPLWLRPYEVLVTSSYTALIETIPDTASLHSIKSRFRGISSLREFFVAKYQEKSPTFKLAQRNFVESMAGYSIVCYLLQVKDRHNGNLLLDEEGHIIHIDFGFMLSNSPGGVNFESAPFKLTRELLEVMDSDAEGVPSEFFDYFKVLCIQGFLTCRKHAERIILLVEMLQNSDFPCFKGGPKTIQNLRKRFHLSLTEEQCVSLVLSLISSSLDAWRTRQYDYYQRVLNGIL